MQCHCWRSRDELISDVLLWTPTYGWAKAGRPPTFSSYLGIWGVFLKICLRRWTIGRSGEIGSGISVLAMMMIWFQVFLLHTKNSIWPIDGPVALLIRVDLRLTTIKRWLLTSLILELEPLNRRLFKVITQVIPLFCVGRDESYFSVVREWVKK